MKFADRILISTALVAVAMLAACGDDSSNSPAPESSSIAVPESSSSTIDSSSDGVNVPESSSDALPASSDATESSSSVATAQADTVWNKAVLTWYISWPDPGSEECIEYNGCEWAGYFAGLSDQQSEEWVSEHNIISIHEKDWKQYKLKTFRLRQNGKTIDAVVYDKCADDDCDGCCTKNAGSIGFLIDVESYTCERFTGSKEGCDGVIEWTCLDCE